MESKRLIDAFRAWREANATLKSMPLYESRFNLHVPPAFKYRDVSELNALAIASFTDPLRNRPATHNQLLAVLRQIFAHANALGWLAGNPAQLVKKIQIAPRTRQLSSNDIRRIVDVAGEISPLFSVYIQTLLLTGCRRSELEVASTEHLVNDMLALPGSLTKSGKVRYIFLPPAAVQLMNAHPGCRVFNLPNIEGKWSQLCKTIGVTDLHIHDLRHALATVALEADMPIEIIGRLLGHSDVRNTRIYAEFTQRQAKEAARKASAAMAQFIGEPK